MPPGPGHAAGHQAIIEPGTETSFQFHFAPPDGFAHQILKGEISFFGVPDRELYVAVHGPDAGNEDKVRGRRVKVEKITDKAQVVGTHAPRTVASIQRSIEASRERAKAPASLVLAAKGASNYRIVYEHDPGADVPAPVIELSDAVADLQRCIKLKSGAELPILPVGESPAIRLVFLEAPFAEWPHRDAYRLRTHGQDVIITAMSLDGLRNGVYGLLTDHLDCHWFMPKQLGEEIILPPDKTVRIEPMDETRAPSFFSSTGMSWGGDRKWDRQNRSIFNRGRMSFGHAWQGLLNNSTHPYDKFPDMWARDRDGKVLVFDKGWSWTNFCSTSPEVIALVAEKINAQFDANPDAIVMSLDPNDLAPMCQCDRCLAIDARYGVKPTDDKQMADRLLHFSKEIHDRLKPAHKAKYLGILAYGFQTRPPKSAVPHPHHAAMVCDFPSYFDHSRPFNDPTSSFNRDFYEIVKGWGAKVKQLGFYDYYGQYNFFGPWGIVHKMREDLPAFRELGGTFVMIEAQPNFAMNGLNLYIASRLVWDLDADVDVLTEEYVTKFYGPAAEPMREFFRVAERYYALERPGTHTALRVGRRAEFWQEIDACLKRAEQLTKNLPASEKRFTDRITFARDGFEFGRRMFAMDTIRPRQVLSDIPAAIRSLNETKSEIDRMKAKYKPDGPYWPTMIAGYFYPDIDGTLARLEKALANPTTAPAEMLDDN
jgi:hypothetical protein